MMKNKIYTLKDMCCSIAMILALLWLTISTPFVYSAQQEAAKQKPPVSQTDNTSDDNDGCNPFANTTEEKAPGNTALSEEYLHHSAESFHFTDDKLTHEHHHSYEVYVAYHGELLSPPPNFFFI